MRRARIKRILAGVEHAAEIVQRGVGIGAPHRLVQRADQIVVAVLLLVVDRRAALHHLLQGGGVENLAGARGTPDLLGQRQRGAAVAVGHADQRGACFVVERQFLVFDRLGTFQKLFDCGGVKRFEDQNAGA